MNGVAVAPQSIAAEAGARILSKGGNAVDAAVAMAFVQGVVDPQMGGLGGLGTMVVYSAETGTCEAVNFYEKAPLAATPSMFKVKEDEFSFDGLYRMEDTSNQVGYKAVCTPGMIRGMHTALRKYGTIDWQEAIAPAIACAEKGFVAHPDWVVNWCLQEPRPSDVDNKTKLTATAESKRIFTNQGEFYRPGDLIVNKDLAETLRRIALNGPDIFYSGEMAEQIDRDFRGNGGILSKRDLERYEAAIEAPLRCEYRGYTVYSSTPPGSGGTLVQMLNILENFNLKQMGLNSSRYIHALAEAMRLAFADRAKYWGDPGFVDIPLDRLLSKAYAGELSQTIERGAKKGPDNPPSRHDQTTTHLSTMDKYGNAVALTQTLGTSAGVVTPGLGFLFNNGMHRFNPVPGTLNSIEPGKSRASALSPTIVMKGDKPIITLGAAGGFRIITGVLQTILNIVEHDMSAVEAVSAPRAHYEGDTLYLERRIPEGVCSKLKGMGHKVFHSPRSYDPFGVVQVCLADHQSGRISGASDPRNGGTAITDQEVQGE